MSNYVRTTPRQQSPWVRTEWRAHSTLPDRLEALKQALLARPRLSDVNATAKASAIE